MEGYPWLKCLKNHSFDFMLGFSYFFIRKKVSKMLVKKNSFQSDSFLTATATTTHLRP